MPEVEWSWNYPEEEEDEEEEQSSRARLLSIPLYEMLDALSLAIQIPVHWPGK